MTRRMDMVHTPHGNPAYVEAQVRQHDHDRYLTGLFAPEPLRPHLWALYGFNAELARVRETVSEPAMGEIRLQWWRDAVTGMADGGQAPRQPVAQALAEAMTAGHLAPADLQRMIDARTPELYDDIPKDWAAFEAGQDALEGQVTAMAARLLGARDKEVEAARAVGQAWGMVAALRHSSRYAAMNRVRLPEDRMTALGVTVRQLYQPGGSAGQKALLGEIAIAARQRLETARAMMDGAAPVARSALLLAPLVRSDLKRLARVGYDPSVNIGVGGHPGRIVRLYWTAARGRF
jgi:phytoene synthase